jgi:hypothetical protein
MIVSLDALPALTRSWLAGLQDDDPDLYAELAESLVIDQHGSAPGTQFPAGVNQALSLLDLRGKEIGAFRFAPAPGQDAAAQIMAYDQRIRQHFDASPDLVFIGDYGSASLFASPQGIGLFDPDGGRVIALAPDFTGFLLVQANAYDAFKRFIVRIKDADGYRAQQMAVQETAAFSGIDVAAIFKAQLTH